MEQTAKRANLSLSAFIRQSVLFCCAPDQLKKILRAQEEERTDPEMRQYLDEQKQFTDDHKPPTNRRKEGSTPGV